MFWTKVVEKFKKKTLPSITFFLNRVSYEKLWKNLVEWGRPQKIRCVHTACWIPKAAISHTQTA